MSEFIEFGRVRLWYGEPLRCTIANPGDASQAGSSEAEPAEPPATRWACVRLLRRLVALLRQGPAAKAHWRVRPLAPTRAPGAGLFRPGETRPRLTLRAYRPKGRCMELELARELDFPHSLEKIVAHLRRLYPRVEIVQPVQRLAATLPEHPRAARQGITETPKAGAALRRGAPPLACNLWLEMQLEALADPLRPGKAALRKLYRPWLTRYHALRGYYPLDPRRSFRAAVAAALSRMRRRAQSSR